MCQCTLHCASKNNRQNGVLSPFLLFVFLFGRGVPGSSRLEKTFRISELVNQAQPVPSLNCAIPNGHLSFEEKKYGSYFVATNFLPTGDVP